MKDDYYVMWLSRIDGMNLSKIKRLTAYFGSAEEIYKAERDELEEVICAEEAYKIAASSVDGSLEKYMESLEKSGSDYMSFFNENYPKGLKDIDDAPIGLYYKGSFPKTDSRFVSMVGSRRCTQYGKQAALKLSGDLAKRGITIVSGLAAGIDSYSAYGTLKNKGITVAVMGTAIDRCYPAENRGLMERIINEGGCILSEYAPGAKTYGSDFVRRNRIIAGLSEVLIIVEAELKSGTSSTVDDALKYGRSIFAVPGSIFSKYSEGTNRLIRDGCPPVLSYEDILLEMGIDERYIKKHNGKDEKPELSGIGETGRIIIEALGEPMSFDELAAKTGMNETRLRSELTVLEIRKIVAKLPGQRYVLVY